MTMGGAKRLVSETRRQVSTSKLSVVSSGKNCFGHRLRDRGHRRVPDPPAKITGTMRPVFLSSVINVARTSACSRSVLITMAQRRRNENIVIVTLRLRRADLREREFFHQLSPLSLCALNRRSVYSETLAVSKLKQELS